MKLESLRVELRPRSPWEAVELGSALVRRNAAAIWVPWLLLVGPVRRGQPRRARGRPALDRVAGDVGGHDAVRLSSSILSGAPWVRPSVDPAPDPWPDSQ